MTHGSQLDTSSKPARSIRPVFRWAAAMAVISAWAKDCPELSTTLIPIEWSRRFSQSKRAAANGAARTAPDIFRRELHGQADPLFGGGERLAVKFFRISYEPLRDPDFRDETLHLFFHAFLLSWLTEKYSMRRAACQCCIPPRYVLL